MTHAEIRVVKHLVETARAIKAIEPGWAWENWTAFQMVMLRQPRPAGEQYEVDDRQYDRALGHAFYEVNGMNRKTPIGDKI